MKRSSAVPPRVGLSHYFGTVIQSAREIRARAGINKYTRLREHRRLCFVRVREREREREIERIRESVGSIVCDFSCAPRGVFR